MPKNLFILLLVLILANDFCTTVYSASLDTIFLQGLVASHGRVELVCRGFFKLSLDTFASYGDDDNSGACHFSVSVPSYWYIY